MPQYPPRVGSDRLFTRTKLHLFHRHSGRVPNFGSSSSRVSRSSRHRESRSIVQYGSSRTFVTISLSPSRNRSSVPPPQYRILLYQPSGFVRVASQQRSINGSAAERAGASRRLRSLHGHLDPSINATLLGSRPSDYGNRSPTLYSLEIRAHSRFPAGRTASPKVHISLPLQPGNGHGPFASGSVHKSKGKSNGKQGHSVPLPGLAAPAFSFSRLARTVRETLFAALSSDPNIPPPRRRSDPNSRRAGVPKCQRRPGKTRDSREDARARRSPAISPLNDEISKLVTARRLSRTRGTRSALEGQSRFTGIGKYPVKRSSDASINFRECRERCRADKRAEAG